MKDWLAALDDFRNWLRLGGPPSPVGYGETSRRSAPESTARGGGWLAALDDFRNWLRLGGPPSPCGLRRDIAP